VLTVLLLSTVLALAAILVSAYVLTRRDRRRGIASAAQLQRKYGLYAENRPVLRLDPEGVPSNLRPLISLAEKWGIGDDIIRNDYIGKTSDAEKRELHDAFYEPYEQVTAWLNSFKAGPMTEQAQAFMYTQLALDEMGYYILEEKEKDQP
jgi:hypothetical protein